MKRAGGIAAPGKVSGVGGCSYCCDVEECAACFGSGRGYADDFGSGRGCAA